MKKMSCGKRLNILCIHQGAELYGSDRSFASTVSALREHYPTANIHVQLAGTGPLIQDLEPICDQISIFEHGVIRKADLDKGIGNFVIGQLRGLVYALRVQRGFGLVYINTVVVSGFILASRFSRARTVVHVREYLSGWYGRVINWMLKVAGCEVIFNSVATASAYSGLRNTSVIYNGVDGFKFDYKTFAHRPLRVLMIGRINSWKGQGLLLEALARLPEPVKSAISTRIVGSAYRGQEWLEKALREHANHLGLGNVSFVPFTPNPEQEYVWADIVVVPSTRPEPFGRVAIEAMSAGCVVIAAAHGGLVEIVEHEKSGLLFMPGDAADLAKMLSRVFDDRYLMMRIASIGRARYHECFQVSAYKNAIIEYLGDRSD